MRLQVRHFFVISFPIEIICFKSKKNKFIHYIQLSKCFSQPRDIILIFIWKTFFSPLEPQKLLQKQGFNTRRDDSV